jgi:hypothetical protein
MVLEILIPGKRLSGIETQVDSCKGVKNVVVEFDFLAQVKSVAMRCLVTTDSPLVACRSLTESLNSLTHSLELSLLHLHLIRSCFLCIHICFSQQSIRR